MARSRYYTLGIDSGTQSTKALLMDVRTGKEVATASVKYPLYEGDNGSREQEPSDWIDAVEKTIAKVVKEVKAAPDQIMGIGVSGQQHGFVPLDKNGDVIRRAKLWNDCSTQSQCEYLIDALGGMEKTIAAIGNSIPPGFTAPKIRWLKDNEPTNYTKLSMILLPHNYINYWLTGVAAMEPGDASGMALYDVANRRWSGKAIAALDADRDLSECLPPLQESHDIVGTVRPDVAEKLGVSTDCIVATGGGDNMMAAIGTGNVTQGVVTASLGTSGTIFACSDNPVIDEETGEIAAFCSSTGGWLPLLCVMNCTVSTELVKKLLGLSTSQLTRAAGKAAPGAGGIVLLPYFSGERTPNVPDGTGVYYGMTGVNFTRANVCRAAMEGAVMSMNYGLERLRKKGIEPSQIRLTGGGANNSLWRQICADVFNAECVTMKSTEAAALGGAIQALWARECREQGAMPISAFTDKFVNLGRARHKPQKKAVGVYREACATQNALSTHLRPVFKG